MKRYLTWIKWLGALGILWVAWAMAEMSWPYFVEGTSWDFLRTKQDVLHVRSWYWSFYVHVGTSTLALVAGLPQFGRRWLTRYPAWHRRAGYLYIVVILLLAGPSGLIMGLHANGGFAAQTAFVLLSLLWLATTGAAWYFARRRQWAAHRAMMIRSYALTLSAITLRLYTMLLPLWLHIPGRDLYIAVSWAGWVLNLLVAECLIGIFPARSPADKPPKSLF